MLYFCHVENHSVVVIFFLFDRGGVGDSLLYQRQDVGGYLFKKINPLLGNQLLSYFDRIKNFRNRVRLHLKLLICQM